MTEDQKFEQYQNIVDKLKLDLKLSAEEKTIVESDSAFKEYKHNNLQIQKAIAHNAMSNKLEVLNKLEENYTEESTKKRGLSRRSYFLLAASLILLTLAYMFLNSGDANYDGDLLAEDMIMSFTDPDATRTTNAISSDDPYQLYSGGKYSKAIPEFRKLIESDKNPKHKFFYGVCLLRKGKWKEAEKIFENKELKELRNYPINYNLAVAKVGLEKTSEAIELLKNPSSGNEIFNREGEKFVKKLQRISSR